MDSEVHKQLLARYLDAAHAVIHADQQGLGSTAGKEATEERGDSSSRKDASAPEGRDTLEPDVVAVEELLARQARALIKLHEGLSSDPSVTHGVDEDLFKRRIADLTSICSSKFYAYRYDLLPARWRQIYADTLILETHHILLRPLLSPDALPDQILDTIVEKLDRALITAGGGGRQPWLEKTLRLLEDIWLSAEDEDQTRPLKRQRKETSFEKSFSSTEPYGRPSLSPKWECPRYSGWTMEQFEDYMSSNQGAPWPIVFTDLIGDWPAVTDCPWKSPDYLLARTFGGRRLVPVEIGRSYVDEGWGQELLQFREFLSRYVQGSEISAADSHPSSPSPTGYLAQHNLFRQIPSLRNDIRVPDFCWVDVPGHPLSSSHNQPPVDVPQLNAWFGPARTITPLHTDGYHNLLCQAVGTKYLRLYPPSATPHMQPRRSEHGVDMSNTSALDVGVLEGWDPLPEGVGEEDLARLREDLKDVEYRECILEPGDTLVIPIGWWHYVRSLSVSFSVSFWWN